MTKLIKSLWKRITEKCYCPNCGWFIACDECSAQYDEIDGELSKAEKR